MKKLSKNTIIGIAAVVAIVVILGGVMLVRQNMPEPATPSQPTTVTGYLGGEKISLFDDQEFKQLATENGLDIQ